MKKVNFLRGLEFSKVLLILDSNEHHLRHLIPEAITRCMEDLTVLIKPPVHRNHKSDTVADLVVEWEKNLDNGILRNLTLDCVQSSPVLAGKFSPSPIAKIIYRLVRVTDFTKTHKKFVFRFPQRNSAQKNQKFTT